MTYVVLLEDCGNNVGIHVAGGNLNRTTNDSILGDRCPNIMDNNELIAQFSHVRTTTVSECCDAAHHRRKDLRKSL